MVTWRQNILRAISASKNETFRIVPMETLPSVQRIDVAPNNVVYVQRTPSSIPMDSNRSIVARNIEDVDNPRQSMNDISQRTNDTILHINPAHADARAQVERIEVPSLPFNGRQFSARQSDWMTFTNPNIVNTSTQVPNIVSNQMAQLDSIDARQQQQQLPNPVRYLFEQTDKVLDSYRDAYLLNDDNQRHPQRQQPSMATSNENMLYRKCNQNANIPSSALSCVNSRNILQSNGDSTYQPTTGNDNYVTDASSLWPSNQRNQYPFIDGATKQFAASNTISPLHWQQSRMSHESTSANMKPPSPSAPLSIFDFGGASMAINENEPTPSSFLLPHRRESNSNLLKIAEHVDVVERQRMPSSEWQKQNDYTSDDCENNSREIESEASQRRRDIDDDDYKGRHNSLSLSLVEQQQRPFDELSGREQKMKQQKQMTTDEPIRASVTQFPRFETMRLAMDSANEKRRSSADNYLPVSKTEDDLPAPKVISNVRRRYSVATGINDGLSANLSTENSQFSNDQISFLQQRNQMENYAPTSENVVEYQRQTMTPGNDNENDGVNYDNDAQFTAIDAYENANEGDFENSKDLSSEKEQINLSETGQSNDWINLPEENYIYEIERNVVDDEFPENHQQQEQQPLSHQLQRWDISSSVATENVPNDNNIDNAIENRMEQMRLNDDQYQDDAVIYHTASPNEKTPTHR